jgi:hypothetical protein
MSTTGRNVVVYGIATLITVQVSCGLYLLSPESGAASLGMLVASLCGLPLLAFVAGYATIATHGRPRQARPDATLHRPRLGAAICFGGMWLAWALLLAVAALM